MLPEPFPAVEIALFAEPYRRLGFEHGACRADSLDDLLRESAGEELVVPAEGVVPQSLPVVEDISGGVARALKYV